MSVRTKLLFAVTILSIIVIPGLANAALNSAGYSTVGSAVWAVGYGSGILMIWYVWIRPLGIHAPDGVSTDTEEQETTSE